MAKIGSPDVGFFLIGGFDLLGVSVTAFNFKHMAELEETSAPGDSDEVWEAVGLSRGELTLSGFYEDAAGKGDVALISTGSDRVVLIGHEGNAIGKIAQGFAGAVEAVYNRILVLATLHKANANFKMNGPIERHRILHAHTAETAASGDTEATAVDGGTQAAAVTITSSSVANPTVITTAAAHGLTTGDSVLIAGHAGSTPDINGTHTVTVVTATTYTILVNVTVDGTGGTSTLISTRDGGAGIVQVEDLTLGGYDDVTIKIRDSTDDIVWADLITFANVSSAKTAARLVVAGTVDRYLSHSWLFNGSGSSQSIKYAVGFARG